MKHTARTAGLALAALTLVASNALAQSAAPPAGAPRLDEGFTWFQIRDVEEPVNGQRTWQGYHVESTYRVFGNTPRGSAMLTVFKEGAREVGRHRCEGTAHENLENQPDWAGMSFDCDDSAQRIRTTGTLTAETYFVDGRTDAQTLLRTHTLNVHTAGNSSGRGSPVRLTPTHYVSRHQEILSAFLTWNPTLRNNNDESSPYLPGSMVYANATSMHLVLPVASTSDGASAIESARLRCTAAGQPVEFAVSDQFSSARGGRYENLSQSVPVPGGSGTNNVEMSFRQLSLQLPFTFPPNADTNGINMATRPGRWQCDLRNNGAVLRSFAFTIGPNGLPQPHPEQAAGLYLGPRAVLVDVTIPAGAAGDQRTAPAEVRAGGFHGRPWATEAMRTAAAAVPALGTPHLDPNPDGAGGGGGGSGAAAAPAGGRGRGRR